MAQNIEKIIESLEKSNSKVDSLVDQIKDLTDFSTELLNTMKLSKKYNDKLKIINNVSDTHTQDSLIYQMDQEKKTIEELENENQELELAIMNHQQVLRIIMTKYHEQSSRLERLNKLENAYHINNDLVSYRQCYFKKKVSELIPLMDSACVFDEMEISSQERLISMFKNENDKIKMLLQPNKENNHQDHSMW